MQLDKTESRSRKIIRLAAHISYWSLVAGMILTAAVYQGYQNKFDG